MSVHTTGTLAPTSSDLQITHQGAKIMLKCIDWGSGLPVIGLAEQRTSGWEVFAILYEFGDSNTPAIVTAQAGGTVNWIKTVLLPKINAALALRFKATGTTTPAPAAGTLADIDAQLVKVLGWAPQADGTLRMVAKV